MRRQNWQRFLKKYRGLRLDNLQPSISKSEQARLERQEPRIFTDATDLDHSSGCLRILKRITQAQHDAAIASVCRPLIKEVRAGINQRVRGAEISRIGQVIELGAELKNLTFYDPRVFH